MDAADALRIENVSKVYRGGLLANDAISLDVLRGEVFGLLGPNGAGKTTLVSQIIGLRKPSGGRILLGDLDLVADPGAARALCGYLPQAQVPMDSLTPRQAVELIGQMRGATRADVRRHAAALFAALEIEEWADRLGARLSGGVQRLVGYAAAVVAPAAVVILDEPTNDVDPVRRRLLWRQIRRLADDGAAVLLVTHNVLEAEQAVDRLAVVDHGRVVAQGTPAALNAGRDLLRLQITMVPGQPSPDLPAFAHDPIRSGRLFHVSIAEADAAPTIDWARALVAAGSAEDYRLGPSTLEDSYLRLVGREAEPEVEEGAVP